MSEPTFRVVFLQQLTGGREVVLDGLTLMQAMIAIGECQRRGPISGGVWYFEPDAVGDLSPVLGGPAPQRQTTTKEKQ